MSRRGKTVNAPGQQVLFAPKSEWVPPNISELPSWEKVRRIGLDTETNDPTLKQKGIGVRHGGYVTGISFAIEDGPAYYLPIRHDGGGNLPVDQVLAYMREQAKVFTGDIVGANLQYDLDYLAEEKIVFRRARFFRDIQIADPLINELHFSYSMQALAKRHGLLGKDEALLKEAAAVYSVDPKAEMWRLHSKYVGPYATEDAVLPLRILRRQERLIEEEGLWPIYDLESKLLPVLVKMRRRGVRIDFDAMARAEKLTFAEEKNALDEVHRLTGIQVGVGNVWSAEAMAQPLYQMGLKLKLDKHKKPMVSEPVLRTAGEVGKFLLRARKVNKARTTFIESIKTHQSNGRIHATFNQLKRQKEDGSNETEGAAYGRLSCVHPNMQQQPSPGKVDKDDPAAPNIGKLIRGLYVPDEGGIWSSADYSQQEPRWLTHFAELCKLPKAFEAAEAYRNNPATDNHDMMAEMCGIERKPAKTIYLGLCYGMGGKTLAGNLGLSTRWLVLQDRQRSYFEDQGEAVQRARALDGKIIEVAGEQAQALLDIFDKRAPYVRGLAKLAEKQARRAGYVSTVLGRHCHFPQDDNGNYDWTYKALNRLIQGSSGDQIKKAMVDADAEGHYLQLQVHDELGQTVGEESTAHALANTMRTCVPCNVPAKVDVEFGERWSEAG